MQPQIRLHAGLSLSDNVATSKSSQASGFGAAFANGASYYTRHDSHGNNNNGDSSASISSGGLNGIGVMPDDEDARSGDLTYYDNMLFKLKDSPATRWPATKEATVLEPFTYLLASPGKDMRSQLVDAFNVWLQVPSESLEVVKQVVGMLHTASLLMDDVEDDSILRRGSPVAHKIYGIPQTINCANYVYFQAYERLFELQAHAIGRANLLEIVNEELINLHRGQGMDLYWRDSLTCPTEQEYIDMVSNKTGGLFRIAIRLMEATSTQPDKGAYVPLVNLIGVLFQIADDYLNLRSDTYTNNKGFCEDLTEGKFSFPVVHSIRADRSNQRILNVLRQKTTDNALKAYAVSYMENNTQSFEYTRGVLARLDAQARNEISRLGGNPGLTKFLDRMLVTGPSSTTPGV